LPQVSIPLALTFPAEGSLLFETSGSGEPAVVDTVNNVILRLLTSTPPGKLAFTIIDPVGLGQSFAGLMHLGDYEESLINRRIWTQRDQIDERLAELSEHIEKVIQMYLRSEYATISEYNAQAGSVAEKYQFLVVADFPSNFSETAVRRLQSIAASGPRCGIFTLIHWDQRQSAPDGFAPEELRRNSVALVRAGADFALAGASPESGAKLRLDSPPEPDLAGRIIHKIGQSSIDSNRVEVPFSQVAPRRPRCGWATPPTSCVWRSGAPARRSTRCSPSARAPASTPSSPARRARENPPSSTSSSRTSRSRAVRSRWSFTSSISRRASSSVLRHQAPAPRPGRGHRERSRICPQCPPAGGRRAETPGRSFSAARRAGRCGIQEGRRRRTYARSLLLIDEFQEFFVEDDAIAQTASLLFDRIVRQGRAFGIHVLLGSQSLGGAYSLARATLGQMVIRVALQCNEADAYLIMDDTNSAPRLLSRPGEGIYNDAGGAIEGNSPFQVVWLPDDERDDWLDKVHGLAHQRGLPAVTPIVFEGNAPADIRENDLLRAALTTIPTAPPAAALAWLGAPNSIKGPTEAVFHRQSGNHLLIVGQRDEAALSMLGATLLSLSAQHPLGTARFVIIHSANPGTPEFDSIERVVHAIPHEVTVARGQDLAEVMNGLAAEQKERAVGTEGHPPSVFVIIHGLHKFKKLRQEDEFSFSASESEASSGAQLTDLICEGSSLGLHLIATVDTFNNVNRSLSRKALSEFEMRIVFQMSANDSASLIDSPKASNLGLHRALFYNQQEGHLETFRPYATPTPEWIAEAAVSLAQRRGGVPA